MRKLLTKKEVHDAIAGTAVPPRVPCQYTTWFNPFVFKGVNFFKSLWYRARWVDDIAVCGWHDLRWHFYHMNPQNGSMLRCMVLGLGQTPPPKKKYLKDGDKGMDNHILVEDWSQLDDFLKKMPNPHLVPMLWHLPSKRYKVAWNMACLFEHHWQIRGMENALMDFYLYPEETHKLYRWLTDFAKVKIWRSKKELHADAVFIGDDMGTQHGPFFSPEVFKEFMFPYYKEMIDYAHSLGMQFWLHTCGNVEMFIPMLIEAGLDVLHPVQKYAMDEYKIFDEFHDQICFMYGFDMQQTIPNGTPDEVEAEVKRTMDLFGQAKGRLVYTSGNVFTGDCPIESLKRLMKVSHTYNPYANRERQQIEEGIRISAERAAEKVLARDAAEKEADEKDEKKAEPKKETKAKKDAE